MIHFWIICRGKEFCDQYALAREASIKNEFQDIIGINFYTRYKQFLESKIYGHPVFCKN